MKELTVTVTENTPIAEGIRRMTFSLPEKTEGIRCGRFVNIAPGDGKFLLRRPVAVCSHTEDTVTICYQIKGGGTKKLAEAKQGDRLSCLLPLGNGFVLREEEKTVALVGGGVGVFPMLSVLEEYRDSGKEFLSYIGYRTKGAVCCEKEIRALSARARIVTDDGSYGERNNAVGAFLEEYDGVRPDVILSCGPLPMLRALKAGIEREGIAAPCYVSLEERMGCGIGACLVCVCTLENGERARVCRDGPVFEIREVTL